MPKPSTFPRLFDDLPQLAIGYLKRNQYLQPGKLAAGTVNWTWGNTGNRVASIHVLAVMNDPQPEVHLAFAYQGKKVQQRIELTTLQSNLGLGVLWYFICPHTGKRCRKLYLSNGRFTHREASAGECYQSQIASKKERHYEKTYGAIFAAGRAWDTMREKHFKKYYAGKPTKRYRRLMATAMKADLQDLPPLKSFL
ncbi:MAG: hypothetical protein AAF998_25555 [Bacteroidota bacterium]